MLNSECESGLTMACSRSCCYRGEKRIERKRANNKKVPSRPGKTHTLSDKNQVESVLRAGKLESTGWGGIHVRNDGGAGGIHTNFGSFQYYNVK
jgi:hypothetical protein